MTNTSLKKNHNGAATLLITFVLFTAAILIIIFAANYSRLQQKTSTNQYSNNQAFSAAEAGLEFGIQYLTQNSSTILANPVSGFIPNFSDSNTSNVTLADNSKYTITYSNPVANNYELILVKSTGTSADGTATHIVQQKVQKKSLVANSINNPATVLGSASLQGNANITNASGNTTILAGGTISLSGSATTTSKTSGSSSKNTGTDIQQNVPALQNMTPDQFFMSYFNASPNTIKSQVANFFPSGSSPNLSGMNGTTIWIDQTYTVSGSVTIGSPTQPDVLIINGDFTISGTVSIYGFVYVIGNFSSTVGTTSITGSIASTGSMTYKGTPNLIYDPTVITNLINTNPSYFAKVTGSWKDF